MSTLMTSRSRSVYHHGDLRAALISEARRVVDASGDTALSLRACARAAGVDIAAAYRHFGSKDEVLAAVAGQGFAELGKDMGRAMARAKRRPENAEACFLAAGLAYVRYGLQHPNLYRLMFGGRCSPAEIRAQRIRDEGSIAEASYDLLGEALDLLLAASRITPRSREHAEILAWSTVHGLVSLLIDERNEAPVADPEHLVTECCQTLVRGWATDTLAP
jgi:AcrR family transcriptional regulator